ncbi:MAG: hypothetical protein FWF01_01735 [Alphaproteobacteria bacterium]|nr:hypothetical protein [Alphaproteobacteria bacterium]
MDIKRIVNFITKKDVRHLRLAEQVQPANVTDALNAGLLQTRDYLPALALCRNTDLWRGWFKFFALFSVAGSFIFALVTIMLSKAVVGSPLYLIALINVFILIFAGLAWFFGISSRMGKFMALGIIVLTWALFSVIDRVYPVDADGWEIVGLWSLCALMLAVACKSAVLMSVWIAVFNLFLLLVGFTVVMPYGTLSWPWFAAVMSVANFGLLVLRELLLNSDYDHDLEWLGKHHVGVLLTLLGVAYASIPLLAFVARINALHTVIGAGAALAFAAVMGVYYAIKRKGAPVLLFLVIWMAVVAVVIGLRIVVVSVDKNNFIWLLPGFFAAMLLVQTVVFFLIMRLRKQEQ